MYKTIFIVLSLIVVQSAFTQKNDTIFLLKKEGQRVYITPSHNSEAYKRLADFKFENCDSLSFSQSLYELKQKGLKLTKNTINSLPKQWVAIYQYKSKYYAYQPSEPMYHYKLSYTDSCFIDVNDCSFAQKIVKYIHINKNTHSFEITQSQGGNKKVIFHIFNRKSNIAVVEQIFANGRRRHFLMIDATHIQDVPLIINETVDKEDEFNFEEPNYKKLVKSK